MKILTVLGARPQFVKAAALSREFKNHTEIKEIIVHTGQHFDKKMSDLFFEELEIPKPDYYLNIHSLSHGAMTGRMLEETEKIIFEEKPDYLLVYGDTNSTLAGALAAKKAGIRSIHIEAGLRNYDYSMPEEINRILTDRISDLLFCSTDYALECLKKEGFDNFPFKIFKVGDIMNDAALYYSQKSAEKSKIIQELGLNDKEFILSTVHRAGNTDNLENLRIIISEFNRISKEIEIVMPVHPRTKSIIEKNSLKPEFTMIEPIGYFDMLEMLKHCSLVITDSGGLQKEAYMFGKKSVILMDFSPWRELVENNFALEAGITNSDIYKKYKKVQNLKADFSLNLYGDGNTAGKIIEEIKKDWIELKKQSCSYIF